MGIYINLDISYSVTKEEWEKVYEETLKLVNAFPLAERRVIKVKGIETICIIPTKEREKTYGYNDENVEKGWFACGDYETMQTAEEYALYRDLHNRKKYNSKAGDAMWGALPSYLNYDYNDARCNQVYDIWGPKTQGELYHMYLLAIACLIEARLGTKAFVYGDVTRGQCKRAVAFANEHLSEPIDVPDRCDMERFYARISKMRLSEKEQLEVFVALFLGVKDEMFGKFIREKFSDFACEGYWRERFRHSIVGTIGFDEKINEYLLWGFDLAQLCRLVNYEDEKNGPRYEEFIRRIMEAQLHIKHKNCEDKSKIDQDRPVPYGISSLFANFFLAGARNKKVDRYIPIEKIREVLVAELGDKCDVEAIIDDCLAWEQKVKDSDMDESEADMADQLTQMIENKEETLRKCYEDYDIVGYDELLFYKEGLTVHPQLQDVLKDFFIFYDSVTEEDYYKDLLKKSWKERAEWLVEQNEYFLLRDKDWEKIFEDISENENAFARYYPMMRVKITSEHVIQVIKALVVNDEFYEFCRSLR